MTVLIAWQFSWVGVEGHIPVVVGRVGWLVGGWVGWLVGGVMRRVMVSKRAGMM